MAGTGSDAETIRLGLVLPGVNIAVEPWLPRSLPCTHSLHVARMLLPDRLSPEILVEMDHADGERAVRQLASARPGAIVYGCVASSVVQGVGYDRDLVAQMRGWGGVPCETSAGLSVAALKAVGARRIAAISPYAREVDAAEHRFLSDSGFEIAASTSFGIANAFELSHVSVEQMMEACAALPSAVDAVFFSCMNMRSHLVVEALERQLDRPVVTATTATAWGLLRLSGTAQPLPFLGRLGLSILPS